MRLVPKQTAQRFVEIERYIQKTRPKEDSEEIHEREKEKRSKEVYQSRRPQGRQVT